MNALHRVESWGETHHPAWLDFLRVALGLGLFLSGVFFLGNTESLLQILGSDFRGWSAFALVHYIAFAHLFGGLMIAMGLLTRLAILFQLPILLGALFFASADQGVYSIYSQPVLSVIVLLMLVLFLVIGSGPHSVDHYYKTHKEV